MLSAIIPLITFYKSISIHFFLYIEQKQGFSRVQMIQKPQRQFKKTEESQGQKPGC